MDKIKLRQIPDVFNLDYTIKKSKKPLEYINVEQNYRTKQTIENWQSAIILAENNIRPMRNDLLDIYRTITLDANITAKMNKRINKSKLQDFTIVNKKGEKDEDLEAIFEYGWFRDFIEYSIESRFWGYSVIQFDDIKDSRITGVDSLDRFYVLPEKKQIRKTKWEDTGKPIDKFDALFIGKRKDLGLLHKIACYALYKKETLAAYAQYVEIFGQPMRVGKIGANSDQKATVDMLKNMGRNAFAVVDNNTDIEFIAANGTGNTVFDKFIEYCDNQINLLITGASDTEKNYAQANKDETTEDDTAFADNLFVEDIVNSKLIPYLISLGFNELEGAKFQFKYEENITIDEQFKIDQILLNHFDVDIDYLQNKYGTKINGVKNSQFFQEQEQQEEKRLDNSLDYKEIKAKYFKKNI